MNICGSYGYIPRAKRIAECSYDKCPHKQMEQTQKEYDNLSHGSGPHTDTAKNQSEIRVAVQRARSKLKQTHTKVQVAVAELRVQQAMCEHPDVETVTTWGDASKVCNDCGLVVR